MATATDTYTYFNPILEGLAGTLKSEMDSLESAKERVEAAKAAMLKGMQDDKACPNTYKASWGQIQRQTTKTYTFRDRGVTLAFAALAKLEKEAAKLKAKVGIASKAVKAAQEAAIELGKATLTSEEVSIRVVKGK